jgi:hypothetical protein
VDLAQYVLVAILLFVLLLAPGYVVLTALRVGGPNRVVFSPWLSVGFTVAAAGLGVAFDLSFYVVSWSIAGILIASTAVAALVGVRRIGPLRSALSLAAGDRVPLLVILAAFAFLVGFNGIPSNPPGTINPCAPPSSAHRTYLPLLHPGPCATVAPPYVSMPRLPERAQDDLLQFRTAQAIWNHKLFDDRDFSGGWHLQDRTPLLGLLTAGLASPAGVALPVTYPEQPTFPQYGPSPLWLKKFGAAHDSSITPSTQPGSFGPPGYEPPLTDRWGYWYYRLLSMLLNALVVLPTVGLGTLLFSRRVGALAGVAAALSPAIMQNAYYTSPKYLGVYFGLCALLLVLERRPALAGAGIGLSYLCHPLGLILAGGVLMFQLVRRSVRGAVTLATVALIVAAPWFAFTIHTGRSSNLAAYPLGCVGPTVTIDSCAHQFVNEPLSTLFWQRLLVLPNLVLPASLSPTQPLQPPSIEGLRIRWLTSHDFTFPGMVGFAFFVFAVIGLIRAWRPRRAFIVTFAGGQLLALLVVMGVPGWTAWLAGLGLLPLIYVFGAYGLSVVSPRTAFWGLVIAGAEWLAYLGALYHPIDNVTVGQYLVCWTLIVGSLVLLGRCAFGAVAETSRSAAATAYA